MSFRYELDFMISYVTFIALLSLIVSIGVSEGAFITSPLDTGQLLNQSVNNTNWTIESTQQVIIPPKCDPIINGTVIPIIDDLGCLGSTIAWMNGLRTFQSSNIWFSVLFLIPIALVISVMIIRFVRGN